jgi:hypothetical protein
MPLTPEDKIEIQELIMRYNRAIDGRDPDGWVETFTPDGVFESLRVGTFRGEDELRKMAHDFWTEPEYEEWRGGQHWTSMPIIEGDGERAEVFCYHIMFMPRDEDFVGVIMAAHDDEVVKWQGSWRFRRRRVLPWPPPSTRG